MKKVFVWRNAFVCLLAVILTFALYQHFWAKKISAQSTTTTRILIPLYTGSDSINSALLLVENTSVDPYGTTPTNGSCTIDIYSGGVHYGSAAGAVAVSAGEFVPVGASVVESLTGYSTEESYERTYLYLTCNFPYAHAQVEFINTSTDTVEAVVPGYIIPPNRSYSTGPEQLLQ